MPNIYVDLDLVADFRINRSITCIKYLEMVDMVVNTNRALR